MDDEPAHSRRLTPSIGLARESDSPASANEDFLFHLYRGSELLQDNRVHEAKEELEQALHLQPRDTKGQDLLAVVYFRLGLYPRAIHIYEQLRRKNTGDTALLLNLALCYLKTGQSQLARRDLEQLLAFNANHTRAWGYLGLACERLGDLVNAERAFQHGGHQQMAKRMSVRLENSIPPEAASSGPSREAREALVAAYQELDAGELSFALAESTVDRSLENPVMAQSWHPVELGHEVGNDRSRFETKLPDSQRGAGGTRTAHVPQLGLHPSSPNRRPTLMAPMGAPPQQAELMGQFRIPSHSPHSFVLDEAGMPSLPIPPVVRPVVAMPSPFGPRSTHDAHDLRASRGATLPPPPVTPSPETKPPPANVAVAAPEVAPPPASAETMTRGAEDRALRFPERGVTLHTSGIALVRTSNAEGFSTRLEAIRGQQSLARDGGLVLERLERRVKGEPNGEVFGTTTSPFIGAKGEGQLLLGARPGRKLHLIGVGSEMCFVREDALLGFGGGLGFENGRLATGENEHLAIVQLRGDGSVLLETMTDVVTMSVETDRSLTVRREVILGWVGRLVPRALAPADAPFGQRGLVGFAGEGRVLLSAT